MVMIRPPACHFWKFLMKNMIPTNSGLILWLSKPDLKQSCASNN